MDRAEGLIDEAEFWDAQLSGKGQYSEGVLSRFDMSKPPPEYRHDFETLILSLAGPDREARVLDVGSGPASVFSWGAQAGRFSLVAADPLADTYRQIAEKYKLAIPSKLVVCGGEDLLEFFAPGHFDFSWCFNAIDHAEDPQTVFTAMVDVTRSGGVVAIQCFEKEGTAAAWTGLHQHDLTRGPNGEMICTARDGSSRTISHPRAMPMELDFEQAFLPKTSGRDWLAFFFRVS